MAGLPADKVVGRTVLELMPDTERHWIETYGRVVMTGEPVHFANYSQVLDRHFEVTAFRTDRTDSPPSSPTSPTGARAESALRESNELFQSVIATTHDGFWINDTSGRILEVNDNYARRSGYSRKSFCA